MFHLVAEAVAHELAELVDGGVGYLVDGVEAVLGGGNHAGFAEDGEVF